MKKMFQASGLGLLLMIILSLADSAWGQNLSQEWPKLEDVAWQEKSLIFRQQLKIHLEEGIKKGEEFQKSPQGQKLSGKLKNSWEKISEQVAFLGESLKERNLFVLRLMAKKNRTEKIPHANNVAYIGVATHYGDGDGYHGKRMANGEIMDKNKISAAHRKLPLGMTVKVVNLENGRAIETIIKDRGPYSKNRRGNFTREIDVSAKAAEVLGFKKQGLALVEIIPLG